MKWKGVAPTLNHFIQPFSRTLLFEEIKILKGNQCGANPPSLPPLGARPDLPAGRNNENQSRTTRFNNKKWEFGNSAWVKRSIQLALKLTIHISVISSFIFPFHLGCYNLIW